MTGEVEVVAILEEEIEAEVEIRGESHFKLRSIHTRDQVETFTNTNIINLSGEPLHLFGPNICVSSKIPFSI